jgi:hypothetical protein
MADYAADVVDIREQFPLFPESATQDIAAFLGIRHPSYPCSHMPIVMTTDFLLTRIDEAGKRFLMAFSIKSADELRGGSRKSVLAKLEVERRYWLGRGIPWHLFTSDEFNKIVIDNLEWLSYFMVENEVDRDTFSAQLLPFLASFNTPSIQGQPLKDHLRECAAIAGMTAVPEVITDMFRYCAWHKLINLDLRVPVGLRCVPAFLPPATNRHFASAKEGGRHGYPLSC